MQQTKYLRDYQAPAFTIPNASLSFELAAENTLVSATLWIQRQGSHAAPLVLDGEGLELVSIRLDGQPVNYRLDEGSLTLADVPDSFELCIVNRINPAANTALEGLYVSEGAFCTQCEAEGFRRISYFLDRPDVLTVFDVTLTADKSRYPYLLSNGNQTDSGELDGGRHWVSWHDPHPKPCYLFALVAGDFDLLEDGFTTKSGREVLLQLYVDKGKAHLGGHALSSLKKAMAWDEARFNLEYDLDRYMIVAVDFFNMGAMENKGLNVFNSRFVLADPQTATDEDFFNVESVIAHEYFHNWTGNRITCRDWFQLSLKEGLTVFRDQQFSADMFSPGLVRLDAVQTIKQHQFAEDAGPMAHPIRPEAVMEMNNFYTVTVYNKGAEVIRMLHTLLGESGFQRGMALYVERHDGQAVTCDDFVAAMADANQRDLSQFSRWYKQQGTPVVAVNSTYDNGSGRLTLELAQRHAPNDTVSQALHIPVAIELIEPAKAGVASQQTKVLELTEDKQSFSFDGFSQAPIVVVLSGFSAPVRVEQQQSRQGLAKVLTHSRDGISRWEASQALLTEAVFSQVDAPGQTDTGLQDILARVLKQEQGEDPALISAKLTLPGPDVLLQARPGTDIDSILDAREALEMQIAVAHKDAWLRLYQHNQCTDYAYNLVQAQARRVKNTALYYLGLLEDGLELIRSQFAGADNMTDQLGALNAAQRRHKALFAGLMTEFEQKWQHQPQVLDKWFALHATADRGDILSQLDLLCSHDAFSINNPNRVRALVGSFAFYNYRHFHHANGSGYRYVANYLARLDEVNPQVASRIITPFIQSQDLDANRQALIHAELCRLGNIPTLSRDLKEKIVKALA